MKRNLYPRHQILRLGYLIPWQQITIPEGHQGTVETVCLTRNDHILTSASWDTTGRLWHLDTDLPFGPPIGHKAGVSLVMGRSRSCSDDNVYAWNIHTILEKVDLSRKISCPCIPDVGVNTTRGLSR
jgi:hypothetical protein